MAHILFAKPVLTSAGYALARRMDARSGLVPRNPVENPCVGFLRGLPKESMRLPLENETFGARDASRQRFRLLDVIAADVIVVADHDQRRGRNTAEPVGRLERVPRYD